MSVLDKSGTERLFTSLMLLVFGTALLVPWGARWQAALNITAIVAMAVTDSLMAVGNRSFSLHWFGLLVAISLAQSAAWLMGRSRQQSLDIRRLTESEERLQREVAQRERAQQQLNESLHELRQSQRDLTAAREQALAALKAKSEFLSSISHEIRTPMNVILGMVDVLNETPLNREQRRHLETMRANGALLLELINSVLDLALIESGRLALEQIGFNLAELAERAAETLTVNAHGKGLELGVRIKPDVPLCLVGDPLRLHQILLNLLNNAIKFTRQGEVALTISQDGQSDNGSCALHFAVSDTGIGIPRDKMELIFSHFTQADSSTTREYGGSGLGLAIVRRLVELMNGKVWVESEIGKGSVFHFKVAFAAQPAGDGLASGNELSGLRILVADRSAVNRVALRELLADRDCEVDEATSAAEITEKVQAAAQAGRPYQCLLADFQMPRVATILCQEARLGPDAIALWDGTVPAIPMLTTDDLNAKLARLRAAAINTWLMKPVKRADLLNVVAEVTGFAHPRVLPVEQADAPQQGPVASPLRILLAEDSADNRLLIQAYLRTSGHELDLAENGKVAIDMFKAGSYDVVLMDHQMPVLDGYAAVRAIREWEHEQGCLPTPIIALTASAFADDLRASHEAGCDAHVSKPVKKDVLLRELHAAGSRKNASSPRAALEGNGSVVVEVADALREIVPGFLANKRRDILALRAALQSGDYEGLQRLGHMLKGEGGSYGFDAITELGAGVEQAAQQKDAQALEGLIKTLSSYLDDVSVVYRRARVGNDLS